MNGGRSGIRTLEGLSAPPVFLTTIAFATKHELVCGLDFVFAIAPKSLRREPSSLYTLPACSKTGDAVSRSQCIQVDATIRERRPGTN